ncbi:MAG: hypothetical protein M3O88_07530, partial [Actinomycetota bacterium]|nr:hypothetical protein [Actinomycetota bacterium]
MAFQRSPAWLARAMKRRWLVAGAAAGVALGSAIGAFAVAAPSQAARVPSIRVLHAGPAFARPGRPVELTAATACERPSAPECTVAGASASIRSGSGEGWTQVGAVRSDGGFRFSVPGFAVRSSGFDYRLTFRTVAGGTTSYPPTGVPLHVSSTAGLPASAVDSPFSWLSVRKSHRRELFLPYGTGPGQVGLEGGGPDRDLLGPSSFAVGPGGAISVVDWVNDRVEVFDGGKPVRSIPTPAHRSFDLALGTGGTDYLLTIGTDGTTYEISAEGRVLGRYPASFGVASRLTTTSTGPAVEVGPSQWLSVRSSAGVARSARLQAATLTASPLDRAGRSTRFGLVDGGRVALTWTRSDGSEGGTLLTLPQGARAGTEYFAEPLADGGAVLALGLWDDTHNG